MTPDAAKSSRGSSSKPCFSHSVSSITGAGSGLCTGANGRDGQNAIVRKASRLRPKWIRCSIVWFVIGNVLLLVMDADSQICTADTHDLGLAMIAMAYARVLWPCTLVLMFLLVLLLCRPCVLHYINDPRDFPIPDAYYTGQGASKSAIEANSKRVKFDKDMVWADDKEPSVCCCICLMDYDIGDTLRVLPCDHDFHQACVDRWLSRHATCPTCRKTLVPTETQEVSTVQAIDAIV